MGIGERKTMPRDAIDLSSIDAVVRGMYAAISGPPGGQDWPLASTLFHPQAQMIRTRLGADGQPLAQVFTVDAYREDASALLKDVEFHECEIARRTIRFGNIAQVFSAYEARSRPEGGDLIKRGMNLIHLFDDGTRWWIMQMIWDDEREGVAIPQELFA
jgi:hypothetical protein